MVYFWQNFSLMLDLSYHINVFEEVIMLYQEEAPGDWGRVQETVDVAPGEEELIMADGVRLYMRSWKTNSPDVLLILHGLGGHGGWYIDMGNALAAQGLNVYTVDHRGFGRSGGLEGHIDDYRTYLKDIHAVVSEIRSRHVGAKLYVLGHSMGGIFAAHFAALHAETLAGVLFLNPWVADTSKTPTSMVISILLGGFFKSKRPWKAAGGSEGMTTNAEAAQMLAADTYWRQAETSSFFFQILRMRSAMLNMAKRITIPALVMQAEADTVVVPSATRKLFDTLASSDKTWKTYPGYDHDSEFQADRSQMDEDIAAWIQARRG
jgi:alpha-beta hydrolase superfamily lysophospholipase